MADDKDPASKTEEASPHKLAEARKKGDVAKSPDVASWLSLGAAFGVLAWAGAFFAEGMAASLLPFVARPHEMMDALETGGAVEIARRAVLTLVPIMAGVMLATAVAGAGGNLIQHGFLWTTEKMKPSLKKINPIEGFKRIFGPDGLAQFVKTLAKLIAVGAIGWWVLAPHAHEFGQLAALRPTAILPMARDLIIALMIAALAFLGIAAGADYLWQRMRFMNRMKMSREEVKDEHKQAEGDPLVKARLRQIRAERARRRMMAAVPTATVVVTNPTHYAVALRYEPGETAAPVCVAKGVDAVALRIREAAGEHAVPIVEDPPLARALFAAVEVDQAIPREHYEAVARVIGFVMSGGRARRRGFQES